MYERPTGRLSFGEVLKADWLFDVYIRDDAMPLMDRGNKTFILRREDPFADPSKAEAPGFIAAQATVEPGDADEADAEKAAEPEPGSEPVLALGSVRRAIILTDDCELSTMAGERSGEKPRGKILLAAIRAATDEQIAALTTKTEQLGLFGLPGFSDGDFKFKPGIVDFTRVFSVHTGSLVGLTEPKFKRHVVLDKDGQKMLLNAWSGHVVRQGETAGRIAAHKLAQLWTAGGNPARFDELRKSRSWGDPDKGSAAEAIIGVVNASWKLTTETFDTVDTEAEAKASPDKSLLEVRDALEDIKRVTETALDRLYAAGVERQGGDVPAT